MNELTTQQEPEALAVMNDILMVSPWRGITWGMGEAFRMASPPMA